MLLATETEDSIDDCTALLSRFPSAAALYESGAQMPNRIEAAAASTPAIHVVAKSKPLSLRCLEAGLVDTVLACGFSGSFGEGVGFGAGFIFARQLVVLKFEHHHGAPGLGTGSYSFSLIIGMGLDQHPLNR